MDFIGVTRTIDQAVYMLLNALAIVLWRIDSAVIGMSLYSYATQDWLTGNGGGVWYIMDWLLDTSGLFGLNTWTLFASLALMLWGLSRIARPFIPSAPVHPGKLLIFFVLSYVVISQGSALMQDIEQWRLDAGSAIYEGVASSGSPTISVPSVPSTSDPLAAPANLDGQSPIRGWEAVASSYFLATTTNDLHQPYPPQAFRVAYCLYNPDQPIESQTTTNAQGCSPQRAWDEWDVSSQSIFDLFGIDIGELTGAFGDFFSFFDDTIDLDNIANPIPFIEHHPENRELGIRQAQAGVARLALGIIVALFPIIEANISLMLALAASFIYLTLPVVVLFGFFLATESMTNRLLMQFVYVIIRTLIINGIVALFMLLLMNTAISGSLTAYLGLVGVGLVGGFFLARIAASTMKETLGQSMGALGSVWMGTTTGLLGQGAAQPAQAAMGMAKIGAAAALLGAGGAMSALDLAETSYEGFRSGAKDMRQGAPGTMNYLDRQTSRLPSSLARMAQTGPGAGEPSDQNGQATDMMTALAAPLAVGALAALSPTKATADGSNTNGHPPAEPGVNGILPGRWQAGAADATPAAAVPTQTRNGAYTHQQRQANVAGWLSQTYQAQQTQRGQKQATERGRDLLGEELAWKAERALGRHSRAEVNAVLDTARKVADEYQREDLVQNGRLTGQAITAVRDQLDEETAQAFSGQKGTWDLAAVTAVALQQQTAASPEAFRQAVAGAESGWGQDSPGHTVPRRLGLDPVAAGAHYTAINRFTRLSEEAGLSAAQREQLLAEAQAGQISDETRAEIEASLKKQREQGRGQGLTSEAIIAGALAMPATLSGPEQVWTTPAQAQSQPAGAGQKAGQAAAKEETGKPDPATESQQRVKPNEKRTVLTQTGGQVYQPPNVAGQPVHLGQTLKNSLRDQPPAKPGQPVTDGKQAKSPTTETETGALNGQNGPGKGNPKNGTTPPPSPSSQNQSPPKKEPGSPKASQAQPTTQTTVGSTATAPLSTTGAAMPTAATVASVKSGADNTPAPTKTTKLGQELNAGVKGQPADAKPSPVPSPGPQIKGDQIASTSPSGQPVQHEPTVGNAAPRQQPMSRSPKTPEPPIGRADFATDTPTSAAASGAPPSIGQQAATSITSENMPTSAATPPSSFGQALRSDQPAPPTAQGQNPPPANPQPVSPRIDPAASSSANQPVRPMSDHSTPVGSQVSPPTAPEIPLTLDTAAPPAGSVDNIPASRPSSPPTPKDPPTRKTGAGQQQKTTSKVTSVSNRREPLKSPRQTGGQS